MSADTELEDTIVTRSSVIDTGDPKEIHLSLGLSVHEPSDEPTLPFTIHLPVSIAAVLKARTRGVLDVAETAALIVQLYANAPLERGAVILPASAHGRICEALGQSPRDIDALVAAIESTVEFSLAGVKMKWNAEEVLILMSRNASELEPKEWATEVFESMKRAWIDGRI